MTQTWLAVCLLFIVAAPLHATVDVAAQPRLWSPAKQSVPIAWRLERWQHQLGRGMSAKTRSYRESWVLEQRAGRMYLRSKRGQVAVIPVKNAGLRSVLLSQRQLFELLGLSRFVDFSDQSVEDTMIELDLSTAAGRTLRWSLPLSADEYVSVSLQASEP